MAREAEACAAADLTIAVSDDDRERLSDLAPGARVTSIPTGVDTSYFRRNGMAEVPGRIVFTGSMDWHPNEDAVLYFIDTMLPHHPARHSRRVARHRRPQSHGTASRCG